MNESLQQSITPLVLVITAASASGIIINGLVWAISCGINALTVLIGVKKEVSMINSTGYGAGGIGNY